MEEIEVKDISGLINQTLSIRLKTEKYPCLIVRFYLNPEADQELENIVSTELSS